MILTSNRKVVVLPFLKFPGFTQHLQPKTTSTAQHGRRWRARDWKINPSPAKTILWPGGQAMILSSTISKCPDTQCMTIFAYMYHRNEPNIGRLWNANIPIPYIEYLGWNRFFFGRIQILGFQWKVVGLKHSCHGLIFNVEITMQDQGIYSIYLKFVDVYEHV